MARREVAVDVKSPQFKGKAYQAASLFALPRSSNINMSGTARYRVNGRPPESKQRNIVLIARYGYSVLCSLPHIQLQHLVEIYARCRTFKVGIWRGHTKWKVLRPLVCTSDRRQGNTNA
jgi:hypothetical protein